MTQQPSIRAEGLVVEKDHKPILDALNFSITPGLVTGLIGPSGSGKTTLMRTIVGVQKITSGKLTVLDVPAGAAKLRSVIGYVTQEPSIYKDLTVVQNLRYFAALVGAKHAQIDEIIATVHLEAQRNQLVENLSGGQRARVGLGVALLGNPELLVLDEPTVGLDPLLRRELWQLFAELAAQSKTILVSSHVMDEAARCDSLLLLHEGKLLWNDSRERLLQATATQSIEDAFIKKIEAEEKV